METEQIFIGIVDDHTLFRQGLSALMGEFKELKVVFEAENGEQMKQGLLRQQIPNVMLMDINMPVLDGYDATAWLKEQYPQIKVLALSMFEEDKAVLKMIRNGARGYVLKESKPREVFEAIQSIYHKGVYLNELVSGKLIRSIANEDTVTITKIETEFMKWCCSELTYKEIADKMFVSPRTVDNYRESLFQKLNLRSRTGLVLYAIQNEIFRI